MTSKAGLIPLGNFCDDRIVDATSADQFANVDLPREVIARYFVNDTGSPIAAANLGQTCFFLDDSTVTLASAGKSKAGKIWGLDATYGVLVEQFADASASVSPQAAAGAFATNAWAPTAAQIINGAIYDVPTTAGASTITLPAGAPDGTIVYFSADGTKNANTVQYVDATSTVNLTTALTASKRHLVVLAKNLGKWFANAYVGP